jgi:ribosomal protein S18 acetylase RimI-like enzyme
MSDIKPEEVSEILKKTNNDNIEFKQLNENSLKNIAEMQKLFPHWSRNSITKKLKKTINGKNQRFLIEKNGEIIGHVKIKRKTGIYAHVAEIRSLIIQPAHKTPELKIKLIKHVISQLPKEIKLITMNVNSKNKNAISIYEKIGFKQYGLLKKGSKINGKFVDNSLIVKERNK